MSPDAHTPDPRRSLRRLVLTTLFALSLALLPAATAMATTIFGVNPRTQFFDGTAIRSFGLFEQSSKAGETMEVWTVPVFASYAPRTDLALSLSIPYLFKRLEKDTATGRQVREADGFGDTGLSLKYTFWRKDAPFARDQMAVLGGLTLPTGSDTRADALGRLPPALQLGSGSVNSALGVAAGRTTRRWNIEGGIVAHINSEANNFRAGNFVTYDLAVQFQTYPDFPTPDLSQLNWTLELNGKTTARDEENGAKKPDSGGTVWFLSPGIQYILSANLLFEAGVQIPILNELSGSQLEPDYTVLFGFRYLF